LLCLSLAILFFSCAERNKSPENEIITIHNIVEQWASIEAAFAADADSVADAALVEAVDALRLSLARFQESDLFRTYRTIPFLHMGERNFGPRLFNDIREVELALYFAAAFREHHVSGELEKARAAAVEIWGSLTRLLVINADKQRNIAASYFHLFAALVAFLVIIVLPFLCFLRRSLTRSLKREAEGTFLSRTYMRAQDAERTRISRELHDTVIQDIRYLMLETEKIGDAHEKSEREKLNAKLMTMMAGLMGTTRGICKNLIPPDFRHRELPGALRQLCLDFGEKTGIDCRAEIDEDVGLESLPLEKRLQVFRIVQEALANIEEHADAREAIVTMRRGRDGIVYVGIDDDGKGFVSPLDGKGWIKADIDKSHLGIVSMRERAAILGGTLKIESEPGEGALVCLEIPPPPPPPPPVTITQTVSERGRQWKYC